MAFVERKLGSLETILDVTHQHLEDIYVQVFCLRCEEPIGERRLVEAACRWAGRHPLLRAAVEVRDDGRYFVPVAPDRVPEAVHWHEDSIDWIQLAEEEATRPIGTAGVPLWRMHFGPSGDGRHVMVFTVNHSIMDAQGFVFVCFEILDILNGNEEKLQPNAGLLPSMDRLLFDQDVYEGASAQLSESWKVAGRMMPRSFTDESVEKGRTRVIPVVFDQRTTSRLLEETRRHGAKMTSTLNCVASLAMAGLMRNHGEAAPESFQFCIAVSLRPRLNIHFRDMGCYSTTLKCRAVMQPGMAEDRTVFWRVAKAAHDELHERLDRGEAVEGVKAEALSISDVSGDESMTDDAYFCLSSLGSYSFGEDHPTATVKLEEIHFLDSLVEDGWMTPLAHGVTTLNGRLFWTISYHDRAMKSTLAEELRDRIEAAVEWIISG